MHKRRAMWAMIVLALLLSGVTFTVLAEQVLNSSEEGPARPLTVVVGENEPDMDSRLAPVTEAVAEPRPLSEQEAVEGLRMAALEEDAPDLDGYTGPRRQAPVEIFSEPEAAERGDWSEFFLEPQPDQDAGALEQNDVGAAWSAFRYEYVAGATFTPRTSVVEWRYPGGGCIYATSNPLQILNLPLSLPQGSRIDYLRIFFYDTSADQSDAWITIYDGAGGFTDLTHVASTGTAGYGTALSPFVGHVVNNANQSYVLNWRPNVAGSSMQLCGLRVAYRLP